jgi:hypothetical protein
MSIESGMQTVVQKKYGSQSQPISEMFSWLGISALCWIALITLTNQGNPTPTIVNAIMCAPILIADFRQHHNKLAIAVLNGVALVALVQMVAYSQFGGLLIVALVFMLSTTGWFVALVWSCLKVQKWEK